ncbi:FemAB family XrtA/PEP-CTERM system-associated protein [Marinimicrobium alkaliphilum]|uniref:FemAB family XrtA/PEP-CTERM system-associated protein n=1 Tax=Marinimicrobium alkaliphilum TaxID=2202654 RepID=UPI0018E0C1AF|nr:FemAB family XrtA/PEP-CTERM system-associated protein [Marinimicrobium alkaliphilum]
MDTKTFLQNPEKALADAGFSGSDKNGALLLGKAGHLRELKRTLKTLKQKKAVVAREFKAVESGSAEHADLVARMTHVAETCKAVEAKLKAEESALSEALTMLAPSSDPDQLEPPFYRLPLERLYEGEFVIRELADEHDWQAWQEFVRSTPQAPLYCQPLWRDVMANAFGRTTRVWAAFDPDGKVLGGVPLTFFSHFLFGRFAVSVPYFNYGGLLAEYGTIASALIAHLQQVVVDERLEHIEIRTMQAGLPLPGVTKKVSMVLALPDSAEALDTQLGAKVRAQCKKADAARPGICFGGLELLDDFYRVFAHNMRDLGTPVYTKRWFSEILQRDELNARLVVVYVDARPVSAGFLMGHNGMLEIPWASTLRRANTLDTNMWMYRRILDYAVEQGYDFFDFGRSTRDAGTYRFKKQWGAEPHEHHWYYILPEGGELPGLNPDNPKFKLMIAVWQRLPVWVSRWLGPPIVKHIP